MNAESFCYWLQGYFELTDSNKPFSSEQMDVVKEHLQLVFSKQTVKCVNTNITEAWPTQRVSNVTCGISRSRDTAYVVNDGNDNRPYLMTCSYSLNNTVTA
jgi:hypothetical protein